MWPHNKFWPLGPACIMTQSKDGHVEYAVTNAALLFQRAVTQAMHTNFRGAAGQYFHYLTKWVGALLTTARATKTYEYAVWAKELALASHRGFVYSPASGGMGSKAMRWKMSVDLSRPLVASQGHHDPLDGYLTYIQVRAALRAEDRQGMDTLIECVLALNGNAVVCLAIGCLCR